MKVRLVTTADSYEIWTWRNDSLARKNFRAGELIEWEAHSLWLSNLIASSRNIAYIGLINDEQDKIGICRFDLKPKVSVAEVAINMNPVFRGQGLSREFLKQSVGFFSLKHDERLEAEIKRGNLASVSLFTNVGFELLNSDEEYLKYSLNLLTRQAEN